MAVPGLASGRTKGVILILGRTQDPCCALVNEQLLAAGRDSCLLPEDQLLPGLHFGWKPSRLGQQGSIEYSGREIDFAEISGILCRAWGVPIPAEDFATSDGRYICAEWNALLMAWLQGMPSTVVNRIRPELWYKAELNAPDLASLVPGLRFKLPRALVTTSIDDANEFCRSIRGPVRYSPLTRASKYRVQTEADRQKLAALDGSLPLHLTEWIEGTAVDAFVIRPEVLFVGHNGRLGDDRSVAISRHCVEISDALGLAFCKLSLVATPDDDWYCLGLDRAPQIYQCGIESQTRIARALVRVLSVEAEPQ
jgi:hypothetical protein